MRGDFVQPSLSEGKRILFLMFWVWIPLSLRDVCHFKPNRNQGFPRLLLTLLSGSREKTRGKGFEYRSGQAGQKDCTHNRNRTRFHARIPGSLLLVLWSYLEWKRKRRPWWWKIWDCWELVTALVWSFPIHIGDLRPVLWLRYVKVFLHWQLPLCRFYRHPSVRKQYAMSSSVFAYVRINYEKDKRNSLEGRHGLYWKNNTNKFKRCIENILSAKVNSLLVSDLLFSLYCLFISYQLEVVACYRRSRNIIWCQ